jgi:hypothetical protein
MQALLQSSGLRRKMTRFKPYIGVTGFKTTTQVKKFGSYVNGLPFGYVMFGFTCSDKRLRDPTSEGKSSPSLRALPELLRAVPSHHLPMIHYFTSTPDNLYDELNSLFRYLEERPDDDPTKNLPPVKVGLQLNQIWPDLKTVQAFAGDLAAVTLQLPREVLQSNDEHILERLQGYKNCVSHVLIDPSGGQGLESQDERYNFQRCVDLLLKISKQLPLMSPGIAGGFSADNVVQKIKQVREASKCSHCDTPQLDQFTIDAQGRLRTQERILSAYPGDDTEIKKTHLVTAFAEEYVYNALCAFFEE